MLNPVSKAYDKLVKITNTSYKYFALLLCIKI